MLKTHVRQVQAVTLVDLSGKITLGSGDKVLHQIIDGLLVDGARKILLHVAGVEFIDSTGLGELVGGLRTVEGMGGALGLVCPEGRVYNSLSLAKLLPVFQVFSNEEEALTAFGGGASSAAAEVLYEKVDNIAVITLNRPRRFNALTRFMLEELRNAFATAGHDAAIRAIVLTGAGRAFCFGADAEELKSGETLGEALGLFQEVVRGMGSIGRPVIAAVNGFATGAGFDLALAADLRVVADRAKLSSAFVRFGLVPDGGSSLTLQRLVGRGRAYELMATGRVLDAEEARQWGIANRVLPAAEVVPAARLWATELARGPRRALARLKQLLDENVAADLPAALEVEARNQVACLKDAEFREGLEAYLAKREPDFLRH